MINDDAEGVKSVLSPQLTRSRVKNLLATRRHARVRDRIEEVHKQRPKRRASNNKAKQLVKHTSHRGRTVRFQEPATPAPTQAVSGYDWEPNATSTRYGGQDEDWDMDGDADWEMNDDPDDPTDCEGQEALGTGDGTETEVEREPAPPTPPATQTPSTSSRFFTTMFKLVGFHPHRESGNMDKQGDTTQESEEVAGAIEGPSTIEVDEPDYGLHQLQAKDKGKGKALESNSFAFEYPLMTPSPTPNRLARSSNKEVAAADGHRSTDILSADPGGPSNESDMPPRYLPHKSNHEDERRQNPGVGARQPKGSATKITASAQADLQHLKDILGSEIRESLRQAISQIVSFAVMQAMEKYSGNSTSLPRAAKAAAPRSGTIHNETPRKLKDLPQHRPPEWNTFKRSIREYTLELIGLPTDAKSVPPSVTEAAINAWDPNHGHCCTLANFCIDLEGNPHSAWNKSAAKVFATGYLKKYKNCQYPRETIEKGWIRYVIGLKIKYRLQGKGTARVQEHKATHRRKQRKAELYTRRLECAMQYRSISDRAVDIVQQLGVDGMSSDESEHEGHGGEATYYALHKDWRSRHITAWLQLLDSLHLRLRYRREWQATAGAWPHFRTTSLKVSNRPPVPQLPTNFYCANWYAAQNDFSRERLQAHPAVPSLEIPRQVAMEAQKYDLANRKIVQGKAAPFTS